jgi:hypothetical protein
MVDLTSPSGRLSTIAGFWDGGATWRARFMPDEEGRWQYRTRSLPPASGLNGQGGSFQTTGQKGPTRFLRHGPVRVSPSQRFFQHADGTPFFWMGDTVWYGAILSSAADWETYLNDRARKRFSVVHFNVVAPRNGVAADEEGQISFEGGEHRLMTSRAQRWLWAWPRRIGLGARMRINPRFYQRLDARIDAVNAHGLLAGIVLTWGLRPADSGNYLPEDEVVRLVRYLEARYGANHVVWILSGDATYDGASGERWRRIGRAAFGGKAHAPVTTHPLGMWWGWDSFRSEDWLDFLVYQSGHGDDSETLSWIHSGPPRVRWRDQPPRPIVNLEPPYEGHLGYQSGKPHTDYSTRRAIYWSLLTAPTAGVTYGAHGVWSWHTAPGEPPTDHPTTGAAMTWRDALSFPGSTQMKYLADFFGSIAWWKLLPDDKLVDGPAGVGDPAYRILASRSPEGDLAVVYLPAGGRVRLREGILEKGFSAAWFDPRTGRTATAARGSSDFIFYAPNGQDWVLLLRTARATREKHSAKTRVSMDSSRTVNRFPPANENLATR